MSAKFAIVFAITAGCAAGSAAYADDAAGLNARVCNNISLPPRDRATCAKEMKAAHTDEDRAKVRKEYEDKIVEARARKAGQ